MEKTLLGICAVGTLLWIYRPEWMLYALSGLTGVLVLLVVIDTLLCVRGR